MFDISFSELLLCFVVALVVLGPERLPGLARGIGRWTGKARSYMRNLSAELDRESSVAEFRQQISDAKRILNEESTAMKRSYDDAAAEGRAIIGEARRQVEPEPLLPKAQASPHATSVPPSPELSKLPPPVDAPPPGPHV